MTTVGLCLPQLGPHVDRRAVRDFAVSAEDAGFDSLWVQEHLFYPIDPPEGYHGQPVAAPVQYQSVFAPLELLAAVAAWTNRVQLGTSVLVGGYHRPVELAQRLATIDQLSGGRLIAGFSVGWSQEEHRQMNVDVSTRGARMTELVDAMITCWGPDPVEFHGHFFDIPPSRVNPKPHERLRPPLLSGMLSPAGLERTVSQYDIWNPVGDPARLRGEIDGLNARRSPGQQPLRLYLRTFLEAPVGRGIEVEAGIDRVADYIDRARQSGADAVIIDANFWGEMGSPSKWAELPARLAPHVLATSMWP